MNFCASEKFKTSTEGGLISVIWKDDGDLQNLENIWGPLCVNADGGGFKLCPLRFSFFY